MQRRCFARHLSRRIHPLHQMLPSGSDGASLSRVALQYSRRMSASRSLSFTVDEEQGVHPRQHHHSNGNSEGDDDTVSSPPVPAAFAWESVNQRRCTALRLEQEEGEEGTAECTWGLQQMLFSLKDHHTNAVSHMDAEERLRGMKLMEEWVITKLFRSSGWLQQLEENGEGAPQHRSVVGEYKILRYLLHRFLSDDTIWRDELLELLKLVRRRVVQEAGDAVCGASCQPVLDRSSVWENSCGDDGDGDDNDVFSLDALRTLLAGPEKMNFYSDGLQSVLWRFLHTRAESFSDLDAIWHAFVVCHRNEMLLASPQRPPFSCYELHPFLTESEFVDMGCSLEGCQNEKHPDVPMRSVTLQWPTEGTPTASRAEEVPTEDPSDTTPVVDDVQRLRYARDVLYMSLVEPDGEETLQAKDAACGVPRTERGLLNPANGEVEDLQLSQLWSAFQKMAAEDIIDTYRGVLGRLELMRREVLADLLTRKGLLLLFFARDEIRAVTPPLVTYRRLRSLHRELLLLMTLCTSTPSCCYRLMPPPSFEHLSFSSKLSYCCFAQLHAPVKRSLRCLTAAAASPAQLYHHYCEEYPQHRIRDGDDLEDSTERANGEHSPMPPSTKQTFSEKPRFEWLNELQQMALQFPFEDSTQPHDQHISPLSTPVLLPRR